MCYIKALIKFSKEEKYRQDILDGYIFFRAIRDVQGVNDPIDSYSSVVEINHRGIKGKIGISDIITSSQPICCFYNLNDNIASNNVRLVFDKKYKEKIKSDLGEFVTIIKDVPAFVDRIKHTHEKIWVGQV